MPPLAGPATSSSLLALGCFSLLAASHGDAQILNSLISLARELDAKPPTSAIGRINIVETGDGERIPLCYLPYLDAFSEGDNKPYNAVGSYEGFAALSLALEHLNTGDGTLVRELSGLDERCPLRFYADSFDTKGQQAPGVNHIINLTDPAKQQQLVPCAILGAARSIVSIPTSIISSLRGFPQISAHSTSTVLDDKTQHKFFGRTIPNDDGTAFALIEELGYFNINYTAVLYINDAYGNAFASGIRQALQTKKEAGGTNLTIEVVNLNPGADDKAISDAIRQLKETQYRYFFGILYPTELLDRVMTVAYEQNIAGTGLHTWFFSDAAGSSITHKDGVARMFMPGEPLEKAYRGTGVLSATGGIAQLGIPGMDAFNNLGLSLRQLKSHHEGDISYLNAHLPKWGDGGRVNHSEITGQETFLSEPGLIAPFLYDAAVGLGLAACELVATSGTGGYFTGEELYEAFVNTTFRGASGVVDIDPSTGTRKPQSAIFSMTNFFPDNDTSTPTRVRFKAKEICYFHSGFWAPIKPYTFSDGTHNRPMDLPAVTEKIVRLGKGPKCAGLVLCGIIVSLAIAFGGWSYRNRGLHVVKASQPVFLYIISGGTLLMGLSILPLAIEHWDVRQKGADVACMAHPWLLAIGFSLTFSALFTKTFRIMQIMKGASKFKRIKLTARNVMRPLVILLFLNIIVLTMWTIYNPLRSKIVVESTDEFDRVEALYAICEAINPKYELFFPSILGAINLGSLFVSLVHAYRARNISTEFSESSYIFRVLSTVFYGAFLSIPVQVIAKDHLDAYYFTWTGVTFVICSSTLIFIFVPKIRAARKKEASSRTATLPPRWQRMADEMATRAPRENMEEEKEGILIRNTLSKEEVERENLKLKYLVTSLSKNVGAEYESMVRETLYQSAKDNMDDILAMTDEIRRRLPIERGSSA